MATRVLLFDGQGCHSSTSASVQHPRTPLATLFLHQSRAAFAERLAALSPSIRDPLSTRATHKLLSQIRDGSIILPSSDAAVLRHPLVALPSLYIAQVVRLLEELETNGLLARSTSFEAIGYSSGVLPALLVTTSFPSPMTSPASLSASSQIIILRNALALFEVALSIGIEVQVSKEAMLYAGGVELDDPTRDREWSAVVLGEKRDALEARLVSWNTQKQGALQQVHLTAQTAPTCHTVSGLPCVLCDFLDASRLSPSGSLPSVRASSSRTSLSSSTSLSSDTLGTTNFNNSLSRKSSASSLSSCPPLSQQSSNLQTSIHSVQKQSNFLTSSNRRTSSSGLASTSKPLSIYALFHVATAQLRDARDRVLASLFPSLQGIGNTLPSLSEASATLNALRLIDGCSLYDTRTGSVVSSDVKGRELVELVVDSILLERVEFVRTIETVAKKVDRASGAEIVNFGPSTSLARAAARNLKECISAPVVLSDVSAASENANIIKNACATTSIKNREPIAIVGMAANFPGARDTDELWRVLEQGLNTVEEIPETRFSISSYTGASPANPGRQLKTRFGNFLPDSLHASFDNAFFRISPREARAIDPQTRILMRVGLQAMEASGLVIQEFASDGEVVGEGVIRSEDVGCFVGVATNDYVQNLRNEIGVHYATGTLPAFLAGRLAYALHLSGPSIVLDTACSSSLVAVHQACRALLAGECKAALAGGVNVISSPDMYLGLDRAHFLSPTGNCKPWDASADGYCRAEGSGIFVLKRLSDALASSDNILGVIRGTEVNQSAAAVSITRPHGPTQETLFRTLLDSAGVKPEEVSVVEAHGTGTQAGDPVELKSLRDVLSPCSGSGRNATNMLTVTSIKGNIGHAEAASGAASLAKVLLMLRHHSIPTQIGLVNLNPKIEPLNNDFTRINTGGACIEWTASSSGRRIALINNFGAAGSNAAVLVEEAPSRVSVSSLFASTKTPSDHLIVGLSAETKDAVLRLRDSYMAAVNDATLVDFGYTATARRKLRPWRIAVAADSAAGLVKALSAAHPTSVSDFPNSRKKIVFLFSGQGGQYIGMGRQLYTSSPTFRSIVDDSHEKLVSWGYPGVISIITSEDDSHLAGDDEIVAFQCAMFVLQCSLFSLWTNWGVKPDAVAGHSLGEYAALVAAGVLSLDVALHLVARRARLMAQGCQKDASSMLLVRLPAQTVLESIARLKGCEALSIACYNGPSDIVVGGPRQQLERLKKHVESSGLKCVRVNVPFAYHTSAMDPVLEDLSTFARRLDFASPTIPIASNVTGKVVHPGDSATFSCEYFAKHCRQAVRFEEGIRDLVDELGGTTTFVEIGPHPITLPMVAHLASEIGAISLHSLHKKMTPRATLSSALSRMYVFQDGIAWSKVYRDLYPSATCIEIPGYPLAETEFWVPFEETSRLSTVTKAVDPLKRFSFLCSWTQKPSARDGNISEFETPIEHLVEYIAGHNVASSPLCPASVYHELALSAATCTLEHGDASFTDALTLSEVQFTHPLVYDPSKRVTVRTSVNLHPKGGKHAGTFTIISIIDGKEHNVHCTGLFQRRRKNLMEAKLQLHCRAIERGKSALLNPDDGVYHETLRTRTIYELIFSRVVQYSKLYQVIDTMTLDERNGEAFATFRLSPQRSGKDFVAQPIFIDTLLHAAGFLINSRASGSDAFICNQVDASKVLPDLDPCATFEVYCTTTPAGEGLMLGNAWAVQTGESRKVVAHMKRMRFSRVRLSSLSRLLSRLDDVPSRNSTPGPFPRSSFERCATPMTPARLGSPFRPAHRAVTPSSMSISTGDHATIDFSPFVIRLVADICGITISDVTLSSNITDLGIDSLGWIELVGQLKMVVPDLSIDVADLMLSTTVGEIVDKIAGTHHESVFDSESRGSRMPSSKPAVRFKSRLIATSVPNDIQEYSPSTASLVQDILGRVLDIPSGKLGNDDNLDTIGLDSLGSIEALAQLQDQFDVSLPYDFFNKHPTIASVEVGISSIVNQRSHSRQSSSATLVESEPVQGIVGPERTLLPLQTRQSGSTPLFLVHDGSGLSNCYSRIGDLDRPLWGISNPKLLSGESWKGGIPEMAVHYVERVKPMVADNGCILGGWSFGGVVAFHMACELMRSGIKVAGVILIDSPSPFTQKPLPEELIDSVICTSSPDSGKQQAQLIRLARTQMSHATKALVTYDPSSSSAVADASNYPNVVMLRCADPFSLTRLRGHVDLERMPFLEDRSNPSASVIDWKKLIGKDVPILDVPGHHFEPFAPKNVSILTQQLKNAIAYFNVGN